MIYKYTDYHLHSVWSHDIAEKGPVFEDYAVIAEKEEINICFLDHYELFYIENDKTYPFYDNKIEKYLDEIDVIKQNYEFVLSGLEIDYYKEYETKLHDFMDDYRKDFDFLAGTLHETDYWYSFTTRAKLVKLLEKKSVVQVVDEYFNLMKEMIQSRIFKNICHLDTIFRYINPHDLKLPEDYNHSDEQVLELGRLCIENNQNIEFNLSGNKFPIGRPFPSRNVIVQLKQEGAQIFVGSDSHDLDYFKNQIIEVKKAYKFLDSIK